MARFDRDFPTSNNAIHTAEIANRDRFTRLLHGVLAVGVTTNLLVSLAMTPPEPGRSGDSLYSVHEWTGIALFAVLLLYWAWKVTGHLPQGWKHFFPWFSSTGRRSVWHETHLLIRFRFSEIPVSGVLSGAIHGLGLLAVTGQVMTGGMQYLVLDGYLDSQKLLDLGKSAHELLGSIVWVYLLGHSAMGVLHQWLGHRSLTSMFSLAAPDKGLKRSRRTATEIGDSHEAPSR